MYFYNFQIQGDHLALGHFTDFDNKTFQHGNVTYLGRLGSLPLLKQVTGTGKASYVLWRLVTYLLLKDLATSHPGGRDLVLYDLMIVVTS